MAASIIILGFIAVLVVVSIAIVVVIINRQNNQIAQANLRAQEFREREKSAVWASATVLRAQGGVITGEMSGVSQWARYDLSLEITPPGGEVYMARTAWLVEVAQMGMLQYGQSVSIRIDQQDSSIIYPNVGWAKYIEG